MADAPAKKQPGQGTAGKSKLEPPVRSGRPVDKKPRPSQLTAPQNTPGRGTNGTSKGANKVSN